MVIMINDVCWSDRGCGLVSFGVFWVGRCYGCVVSCGFVFGVFVSMYFVHCFVGFSCCSWVIPWTLFRILCFTLPWVWVCGAFLWGAWVVVVLCLFCLGCDFSGFWFCFWLDYCALSCLFVVFVLRCVALLNWGC